MSSSNLVNDLFFIKEMSQKTALFSEASSNDVIKDVVDSLLFDIDGAETSKMFYKYIHAGFDSNFLESEAQLKKVIRQNKSH